MTLTVEQFKNFQTQAESIIKFSKRKEALELARQLETQIADSEISGSELFRSAEKLIAQLKWMACPLIRNDREFFELIKNRFLEGLALDAEMGLDFEIINIVDLTVERLASQFGVGLEETVLGTLETLRKNNQIIGSQPITIKGTTQAARPTIQNWLLDFLKNTPTEDPAEMEEADYLFNNQNAQTLSEEEKKLLGKTLAFYDTLRLILKELTNLRTQEKVEMESYLPPTEYKTEAKPFSPRSTPSPAATPVLAAQKSLRQLVKDNKDALNQTLTNAPIKITDFDQPVRPTIKNWLVDYVKIKGAGHHEALERSDYLFNSPNSRALSEEERALVAEILKAYDEDSPLPINAPDQTILLEKLVATAKTSAMPRGERSEFYGAAPRGSSPAGEELYGGYREPISQEDLAGPLKQTPPKPTPRLSGNIIDLKDMQ